MLDLRFPVLGDARELSGSLCLTVDVRYGDDRVSDSTAILEDTGGDTRFIRVRSAVPVNEPIVSVRLQAGCEQPLSRTYTLLAGAPVQTAQSPGLPARGSASPSAPAPATARSALPYSNSPRASGQQASGRVATPARGNTTASVANSPVRPRAATATPRAETGAGVSPRSAQGPIASNGAPARASAQPVLQLEDPAYFRQAPDTLKPSDALANRPAASTDERQRAASDWGRLAGSAPEGSSTPTATPPASSQEDQVALMRAELAAARKEIARLQSAVTARAAPPPEDTDYRPYLLAALGALLAAAGGAWVIRRNRQRKTEAGAWWHGSHSVQAPASAHAAFDASAAGHTDLGSVAAHDLAYPVSMLPEDLERSSMFPDFLRQDARSSQAPYGESGVTLPGETQDEAPQRPILARETSTAAAVAEAAAPVAVPAAAPAAMFEPQEPVTPAPSAPRPAAAAAAIGTPAEAAAYWKEEPKYRELDLDLDVDSMGDPLPAAAIAQANPAPAAPAWLDEGNLIDFESSGLGSFVKPSSRERQD